MWEDHIIHKNKDVLYPIPLTEIKKKKNKHLVVSLVYTLHKVEYGSWLQIGKYKHCYWHFSGSTDTSQLDFVFPASTSTATFPANTSPTTSEISACETTSNITTNNFLTPR